MVIEEQIQRFDSFFDAETLYQQVSKKDKTVGIATVYRLLKALADTGKIHSYSCNRRTIYSTSKKSHCHFICETCQNTTHIYLKKLDFLQKEVRGDICHLQIDIAGRCEKCQKKQ